MAVIYVGRPAIDRTSSGYADYTMVNQGLVANDSGIIDTVGIWSWSNLTSCKVIIFSQVDATHLTARSFASLAEVVSGAERIFKVDSAGKPLSLNIVAGDLIGVYALTGLIRRATSGFDNVLYLAGDQSACSNKAFSAFSEDCISIYGTGTTVAVGIKWNGVTITKWNGQVITKLNGLP